MSKITVKKEGSDRNGNYQDVEARQIIIDLDSEIVTVRGCKVFKDSAGEIIIEKDKIAHALPDGAYNYLLTAAKITKITEYIDAQVNPPEEPEA